MIHIINQYHFTKINESNIISDIDVFGSRIFLNLGNTMIAGNPTVSHPMFWQDPFPDINENIKSLYVNDTTMIIKTNQKSKKEYFLFFFFFFE